MIELKDAIEISRILAKAPQERLPMILSVFEKAELTIEGLEELEAWAISKDRNNIIELDEFMKELDERFKFSENGYCVIASEFTAFCNEKNLDARAVRGWLARKGVIKTEEYGNKTSYTITQRINGKTVRCILINKDWKEAKDEATQETYIPSEEAHQQGRTGLA